MAAASYTTDLVDWIADADTAAWSELTNAIAGGAPDEADTESALQGTNTVSQSQNTTGLCSMARILGASQTFSAGQVAMVWHGHGVATALQTYANNGLRVAFATDAGNWKSYTVAGGDVPPFPYGKWLNSAVDPALTPDATNGTAPTTTVFGIGSMAQLTTAVAKGQPHVCDMIRYGRAESRMNGGDLANGYATFAGFAAQNDATANRWGLIQSTTGGYQWKGLMVLGHASAVDFRDSNVNVFIQDCRKVSSTFNKIEIRQASSRVDWTNVAFINASPSSNASRGDLQVVDNADVNIDSASFTDMGTFAFLSNSSIVDSTFRRCGLVTQGGATISGTLFARATGTALLSDAPNLISSSDFLSVGTGHAIEITTPGTYSFSGNQFTGYSGTGTDAAIYNNSGGLVTLNISGGGGTPTVRNGTGASTVVNNSISLTLTGIVDGSEVRIYSAGTITELFGVESKTTDPVFSYSTPESVDIVVHSLAYQYFRINSFPLASSDASLPIAQIIDRNYKNP